MTDFPDLYARHRDEVWRYFRRRTPEAAEDLVTEVFVVAWRRRADVPAEALPWLYGVARKVLANHRRGDARRDALVRRAGAHAAAAGPDPAELVGARAELARALATLRDQDRELVLLIAWEGLSIEEAATALGCRRGTAAVRLHRARRRLATAMSAGPAAQVRHPAPTHL
jgi:RNA polymerase sigma-70 factor (ECF subfamily)